MKHGDAVAPDPEAAADALALLVQVLEAVEALLREHGEVQATRLHPLIARPAPAAAGADLWRRQRDLRASIGALAAAEEARRLYELDLRAAR